MAEPKTKPTTQNPRDFLHSVEPEKRRQDGFALLEMFEKATGQPAVMWGKSIVGFGVWHYKSERSRQEGDWPMVAYSPRKQSLTLYIMSDDPAKATLLEKLGKHKTSKGCLYINKLEDVDKRVLQDLIIQAYNYMVVKYAKSH